MGNLKELRHGILTYFHYQQNYLYIKGNLKLILYKYRKNIKEITINHEGTGWLKMEKIVNMDYK